MHTKQIGSFEKYFVALEAAENKPCKLFGREYKTDAEDFFSDDL